MWRTEHLMLSRHLLDDCLCGMGAFPSGIRRLDMTGFIASDGSELVGALNPASIGQALQVDASGNLKVTNGGGGASTLLNQASAAQNANGNSVDLSVVAFTQLAVDANVTALTGTNPTTQFFVARKGADGIHYQIWSSASLKPIGPTGDSI